MSCRVMHVIVVMLLHVLWIAQHHWFIIHCYCVAIVHWLVPTAAVIITGM